MPLPMPMPGQPPGIPGAPPTAAPPAAAPGAMPTKHLGTQAIGMGLTEKARAMLSVAVPMLHGSEVQEAAVKALAILIRALPGQPEPAAMPQGGMPPPQPAPPMAQGAPQ